MNKLLSTLLLGIFIACPAYAKMHPMHDDSDNIDCHNDPMVTAGKWLKENKIASAELDLNSIVGEKIAAEKIKNHLWNNVFHFAFKDVQHNRYDVITRNVASDDECSISDIDIYLVTKYVDHHIGDLKQYEDE